MFFLTTDNFVTNLPYSEGNVMVRLKRNLGEEGSIYIVNILTNGEKQHNVYF